MLRLVYSALFGAVLCQAVLLHREGSDEAFYWLAGLVAHLYIRVVVESRERDDD